MPEPARPETQQVAFRIPKDLLGKIDAQAAREFRSRTSMVLVLLARAIETKQPA